MEFRMSPLNLLLSLVVVAPAGNPTAPSLGVHTWQSRDPDFGPLDYGVVGRIGSSKLRHGAAVRSMAFSPDGALLVSSDKQGTVIVWEAGTGRVVRRWDLADGFRGPVGFSADGERVVWGTPDGYVRSTDIRTGSEMRAFPTGSPYGVRSIEAGQIVVTDLSGRSRYWDEVTGRPGEPVPHDPRPSEVLSTCGKYSVSFTSETVLTCRDRTTGTEHEYGPGEYRFARSGCMRFSPDGTSLFAGETEGGILQIDRSAGKVVNRYGPFLYYPPDRIAITPDGSCLAVAAGNRIHLFDTRTGRERFAQPDDFGQPPAIHLSPDNRFLLLSGCYTAPREEAWDLATLHRVSSTSVPIADWQSGTPLYAKRTADGRIRVSHGGDTQFNQFDTSVLRFWNEHGIPLWSVKKGLSGRGGYGFSPDGSLACVVEDKGLGVYQAATGWSAELLPYETELSRREWAGAVAFTPDRYAVVSAHPSGLVYSPLGGGARPREVRLHKGESLEGREGLLAISPDGLLAVVGTDRLDLIVFELSTLQERFRISTRTRGPASSVLFAPDARYLIVANGDSTVTIHDLAAGHGPMAMSSEVNAEAAWADLSADAGTAFRTMRVLAARGDETVAWLRQRMPPPAEPGERIVRSVSQLDAARYQVRETAQSELTRLAHQSRPALLAAARTDLSPEMRRRVEMLLQATRGPDRSSDGLRSARAVEVLERIGSPNALALLRTWSAGPPGETLADASRAAVQRMAGR
jgi:WD40 repeat protein